MCLHWRTNLSLKSPSFPLQVPVKGTVSASIVGWQESLDGLPEHFAAIVWHSC